MVDGHWSLVQLSFKLGSMLIHKGSCGKRFKLIMGMPCTSCLIMSGKSYYYLLQGNEGKGNHSAHLAPQLLYLLCRYLFLLQIITSLFYEM